jgi:hypothetical protein
MPLTMDRRSILRLFASTPVAAPMAAKALNDQLVGDLAGVKASGLSDAGAPSGYATSGDPTPDQVKAALGSPPLRGRVVSALYEEERRVFALDPDLAALRSFSLNAKIVFQRQRNVERRLAEMQTTEPLWRRAVSIILSGWQLKI